MYRYALAVVVVLLTFFSGANALAQTSLSRPEIEQLVRAFRSVEVLQARAALYVKSAAKPADPETLKTFTVMERLASAQPEVLFPAFVQGFSALVTPQEAQLIMQALSTPVGQKIIAISVDVYRVHNGDMLAARDANPLSPEERQQFEALGEMPGWKIYERLLKDASFAERLFASLMSLPLFADMQ